MEIRFVSSLSEEDEEALAATLSAAVGAFLDETSLNYALTIETSSKRVYQRRKRPTPVDEGVKRTGNQDDWPSLIRQ